MIEVTRSRPVTHTPYLIDGMSDQGFGESMVYVCVTRTVVEITLLEDWSHLWRDDFQLIGHAPTAPRYVHTILGPNNKVTPALRVRGVRKADTRRLFELRGDKSHNRFYICHKLTQPKLQLTTAQTTKVRVIEGRGSSLKSERPRSYNWFRTWDTNLSLRWTTGRSPSLQSHVGHTSRITWTINIFPVVSWNNFTIKSNTGFYGGPKQDGGVYPSVDVRLCRAFIRHTHKYINEHISTYPTFRDTDFECLLCN